MKENIIITLLVLNLFVMACILYRLATSRAASFANGEAISNVLNEMHGKITQSLGTIQVVNIENAKGWKEVNRIGKAVAPKGKAGAKKTVKGKR